MFIKGLQNCNFIKAGQPQWPFCQASEGRVARARVRNFGAGSWPVASRNNFPGEASATAIANPRRRSRALRCSGAGGWPVRLPEVIFRATAKASPLRSLPSFWRWGVAGQASRNVAAMAGKQPEADKWPDL